jgi:hypothetical protein
MHEFGIGRERHRLRLRRRIDDDAGEVRRLGRANARGDIQALLNVCWRIANPAISRGGRPGTSA